MRMINENKISELRWRVSNKYPITLRQAKAISKLDWLEIKEFALSNYSTYKDFLLRDTHLRLPNI